MKRCERASTDPEPTTADLVFAIVFLVVVLGCFVMLWYGITVEFTDQVLLKLAAVYPH